MPCLYQSVTEFESQPLSIALSAQFAQLPAGTIDALLARASQRVNTYCKRRIGAPGSSTLAQLASAGGTSISVASTLTLDNLAELAAIIDTGATQETVAIAPGGVTVSSWTPPYPGTIQLATPLAYGHAQGAPVQFCYKETTQAGRASSSDPYTESLQTQAAQLALSHLPALHPSLTRVVFTKAYPIQSLLHVEHAYSFDNAYMDVDMSGITVVPTEGWYRFRVGQVIIPEGMVRTTYTGGYTVIPDDIKDAMTRYVALDMMQMVNPYFVQQSTMGKRTLRWDTSKGKYFLEIEAEEILKRYRRLV